MLIVEMKAEIAEAQRLKKLEIGPVKIYAQKDLQAPAFESHPLRQKPGSPQAFRAFFLQRKASLKSTKCTFLTHTVFYERGFEKHFQPLYNSNRYNRRWKHSDKKRKNTQALTQLDLLLGNT